MLRLKMTRWARPSQGKWQRPQEATSWSDLKSTIDNPIKGKKSFKKAMGDSTERQITLTKVNQFDELIEVSPKLSDIKDIKLQKSLQNGKVLKKRIKNPLKKTKLKNKEVLTNYLVNQENEKYTAIKKEKQEESVSAIDMPFTLSNKINKAEKLKKKSLKRKKEKMDQTQSCLQTALLNENETYQINDSVSSDVSKKVVFKGYLNDNENKGKGIKKKKGNSKIIASDNPLILEDNCHEKGESVKNKKKKKLLKKNGNSNRMVGLSDNPTEINDKSCKKGKLVKTKKKKLKNKDDPILIEVSKNNQPINQDNGNFKSVMLGSVKENKSLTKKNQKSNSLSKKKNFVPTNRITGSESKTELSVDTQNDSQNTTKDERKCVAEIKSNFTDLMRRILSKNSLPEKNQRGNRFKNQFSRKNPERLNIHPKKKNKWKKDHPEKVHGEHSGLSEKDLSSVLFKEARRNSRKQNIHCWLCQEANHRVSECPVAKEQPELVAKICYHCGSSEHTQRQCTKKDKGFKFARCFKCKQQGHVVLQCPEGGGLYPSGGSCLQCGSIEHYRRNCPELDIKQEQPEEEEMVLPLIKTKQLITVEEQPSTTKLTRSPRKQSGVVFF